MPVHSSFGQRVVNAAYSILAISICLMMGYAINFFVDIIPASLYGMFLMALGLKSAVISADKVACTIDWIIKNMGVCFVPAGVGVMEHFGLLKLHGTALITLTVFSTLILMLVVGFLFQYLLAAPNHSSHANSGNKAKGSAEQ